MLKRKGQKSGVKARKKRGVHFKVHTEGDPRLEVLKETRRTGWVDVEPYLDYEGPALFSVTVQRRDPKGRVPEDEDDDFDDVCYDGDIPAFRKELVKTVSKHVVRLSKTEKVGKEEIARFVEAAIPYLFAHSAGVLAMLQTYGEELKKIALETTVDEVHDA